MITPERRPRRAPKRKQLDVDGDPAPAVPPAPTATPERGEHLLTLAGITYRLRPSHAALRAMETNTDRSLLGILRLAGNADLTLEELGEVAAQLIRAGADPADQLTRNVSPSRISELIYEEGLPRVLAVLTVCLTDAVTGGRDAEGNVKAAPAMGTSGGAGAA